MITSQADTIQILKTYSTLMEEIKERLAHLLRAINSEVDLPGWALADFGYVQLRKICELVALACLVAHGDLIGEASKRLAGEWEISKIIRGLERLHPHFFPRAAIYGPKVDGKVDIQVVQTPPLTKAELLRIHGSTGHALHRGTLAKLIKGTSEYAQDPLFLAGNKIGNLLSRHVISSPNMERHIICTLAQAETGGKCYTVLAEGLD